jgi:predicted N-acetyltransferase YhbS
MITLREETPSDIDAREALLDSCFGPERFEKTCERLREGRLPADHLALVAADGEEIVGSVRLWHVAAGPNRPALLLGPLAVDPARRSLGIGGKLMRSLWLPGSYDRERFLGIELAPGALDGARGLVSATGALEPKPDLAALAAAATRSDVGRWRRAA